MGTRADFYIGRGKDAEWIGSIAWDGDPSGIDGPLLHSKTEVEFRENFSAFASPREDITLPADGWPWPWTNSQTTDFAYAIDGGKVWASSFGTKWFDPLIEQNDDGSDEDAAKVAEFPEMSGCSAAAGTKRSGVLVFYVK